jgi:membrane-associated phospholipid phosphatase
VGTTPPDEATRDWSTETALEHSDSWSATSFLDVKTGAAGMMTGPRDRFVDLALLTLACCAGEIASVFGKFYGFEQANAVVEMIAATVKKAFPMTVRHPGSTPSSDTADAAACPSASRRNRPPTLAHPPSNSNGCCRTMRTA